MSGLEVGIRPVVTWPRRASRDGRYVVVADVILAEPGDWPYQREEFVIGCVLEGGSAFSVEALGSTSLVLHRFGGTYGPVRFLVRAERDPAPSGVDELRLTFLTEGGVPFRRIPLAVRPLDGADDEWPSRPVEVFSRQRPPDPAPTPSAAAPPTEPETYSLTVLHLSDLWFFDHRAEPDSTHLYTRLLDDVAELSAGQGLRPDLVVVAGDLAQSGRPREFARAFEFLAGISEATGVPRKHFAIVPGNHDVNRTQSQAYFLRMEAEELAPTPPYYPKWRAFADAFHEFYSGVGEVSFTPDEPWTMFPMPDLGVVVAGLNSTMAESHLPQSHYGALGEAQLHWFARRLTEFRDLGWLRLATVHHDPSAPESDDRRLVDAADLDRVLAQTRLVNAVLHGTSTRDGSVRRLPSGLPVVPTIDAPTPAAAGGQQRCQLIAITADGLVRYGRRYEPEADRWVGDTRISRAGNDWRDRVEIRFTDVDAAFAMPDRPAARPVVAGLLVDELMGEVTDATRVRYPNAVVLPRPEAGYLRVVNTPAVGAAVETWPVGVVDGEMTRTALETFVSQVHSLFAAADSSAKSDLVHTGAPASDALADEARRRGVRLHTLAEYQRLVDLGPALDQQRRKLSEDHATYVPQRFRSLGQGADGEVGSNALEQVTRWLSVAEPRLILVLGSFGTGKTTFARRLADTLPEALPEVTPILIDLRRLEGTHTLDGLIAAHLAGSGLASIDVSALRYMIRRGRVVLIFDGFDELVLRTNYDAAADRLDALMQVVEERAKVVVTARTQHFRSTAQVLTALGERVLSRSTTRVMELQDFDTDQIRSYLSNVCRGDEAAASARFQFLTELENLLGLARNPRMLSFIAALPAEKIQAIQRAGRTLSAAGLYREIIDSWVGGEVERRRQMGSLDHLDKAELIAACTALARWLWHSGRSLATAADLSDQVVVRLADLANRGHSPAQATHAIGSGSLLERTEDGLFAFVHESVAEWLVADATASDLAIEGESDELSLRPFSALMINFLCDLGNRTLLESWCIRVLAATDAGDVLAANARRIADRLRIRIEPVANLGELEPDPRRLDTLDDLVRAFDTLRRRGARKGQERLSVRDLAQRTGTAPSTLDPYLRGIRLPPADIYEDLLHALGIGAGEMRPWLDAWARIAGSRGAEHPQIDVNPGPPDYLASQWLDGERPFLDRVALREGVRALLSPEGPKVLVVRGHAGSGKTWSRHLVAHAAREHGADTTYLSGGSITSVDDAVERLFQLLQAQDLRPASDTTKEAWFRRVSSRMAAAVQATGRPLWITVDDLGLSADGTLRLDPEIRRFFDSLALSLTDPAAGRWFRLVLLDYPDSTPTRWEPELWTAVELHASDIALPDVAAAIVEWFGRSDRELRQSDAMDMAERVVAHADEGPPPGDPNPDTARLRRIHDALVALLRGVEA